jgi:hypothetical protein
MYSFLVYVFLAAKCWSSHAAKLTYEWYDIMTQILDMHLSLLPVKCKQDLKNSIWDITFKIMTGKLPCANWCYLIILLYVQYSSKACLLQFLLLPSAHYQGGELIWIFCPRG